MKLDPMHPFLTPFMRRTMDLVRPMDVQGGNFVRKGREGDGGYVMLDELADIRAAYSIGIGGDVSWDAAIATHGIDVWQYDHTVEAPPLADARFHFHRLGVAATASKDGTLRTLESLVAENGHDGRRDLILKMDIEGGEWEVFSSAPMQLLEQFSQILVEFHGLCDLDDADKIWRVLDALSHLQRTHQSVHVHANNWGTTAMIGGVTVPETIEVTFVRRSDHVFSSCHRIFPTELDFPNHGGRADIFLGALGLA
jgi:hypothetical protein